jgi:hypothetical protein
MPTSFEAKEMRLKLAELKQDDKTRVQLAPSSCER